MPLYEITANAFRPLSQASFADLKVRERDDLQRLLRTQIEVLGDDLYILAEEFGDWEDSKRRIDLLAIDKEANLVVIELKRTNDGGHMELQAIRYASMVSTMTFERAVQIHGAFLAGSGQSADDAQGRIMAFLGWEEPNEEDFAPDVRILLVSENFGKELTTAVLWLREREIDIRCIRLIPYREGDKRLIDVQQIIPLPEANDYQVQIREKEQVGRKKRTARFDIRQRFWDGFVALAKARKTRYASIKPAPYSYIGIPSGFPMLPLNFSIIREAGFVEIYIDRGDAQVNKHIFDSLYAKKDEVEKVFGAHLEWERLDDKRACRIKHVINSGYTSPESKWGEIHAEMLDAMTRLEAALKPHLAALDRSPTL